MDRKSRRFRLLGPIYAAPLLAGPPTAAQSVWTAAAISPSSVPPEVLPENRLQAQGDALPDGLVASASRGDIAAAWYTGPTTRYGHAVLEDAIEAGWLHIRTRNGKVVDYILPKTEVFEHRAPRPADLDADGTTKLSWFRAWAATRLSWSV